MENIVSIIVTVLCSVIASSGFWAWIQKKMIKIVAKSDAHWTGPRSHRVVRHDIYRAWMDH